LAWFRREQAPLSKHPAVESRVPEGLWSKCENCKEILYRKDVIKNLSVCPKCAFHFRLSARERLELFFDGPWEEFDAGLVSADPLGFHDSKPYADRLKAGKAKTDSYDAVVSAVGTMGGRRTVIAAMEYGSSAARWASWSARRSRARSRRRSRRGCRSSSSRARAARA
jgi:acetyl-CoA carboxylase carboxyl transferase subunit beta